MAIQEIRESTAGMDGPAKRERKEMQVKVPDAHQGSVTDLVMFLGVGAAAESNSGLLHLTASREHWSSGSGHPAGSEGRDRKSGKARSDGSQRLPRRSGTRGKPWSPWPPRSGGEENRRR